MAALRSADEIRDVNTRYHDVAADSYDAKWGIDFGEIGRNQVLGKLRKLLGSELDDGYGRSLEIGAGTGYFSLNMLQAGLVDEATCTDISPGMLATLAANARRLGLSVRAARADAESLPFAEESFDLVLGHAVLHHLPNLRRAFTEFHRFVDIHAFAPGDLFRHARRSGFTDVVVRGEELAANWFGWFNRGLEASADPADVPMLWRQYAFHGYLMLQRVDEKLLEPLLPPAIFYNLLLTARRP
ncbi:MAG: methyltransferase domain-containing protein [Actinobacteria bacterium]|nr:methyltransferase domain-containing protein [Actinomycetota bacterium]